MNQVFARKITSFFLCCCLLLTVSSGTAISAQAEELGIAVALDTQAANLRVSDYDIVVRLRNFYDTATFNSARNQIDSAITFVKTIYVENYSIFVGRDGSVVVDTISDLSSCTLGDTGPCRASSGCGTNSVHHKDVKRISDAYNNWYLLNCYPNDVYENRTVAVLWTNYSDVYCYNKLVEGEYTHLYLGAYGYVHDSRPVVHIMNLGTSAGSRYKAHMSFLLAHELAHTFGVPDVYDTANHYFDTQYQCLMDSFGIVSLNATQVNAIYENWLENPDQAFCSSCKTIFRALL